ncbi:T9SS type A sorting domain-containing protein [Aquimarina agarivorans]|uniref:T9SS type A sorting domain-containing protein n=1 Tax=Aquimarina agarivorans TaxID=980584 RepID=UPI000248E85B|nr:T9SS type A sorting domain-containing protein [Aquimarina agarivorans]
MIKKISIFCLLFLYVISTLNAQIVTECKGVVNPSNRLWQDYTQNLNAPKNLPNPIPKNISYPGLVKKIINPNFDELKKAMEELAADKGGVISFKNVGNKKNISFKEAIDISNAPSKPCVSILIEGDNKITFDGNNTSSMFVIRKSVKFIVQNATFQNGRLKRAIIQDRKNFRTGGGAIESNSGAAVRVYNCKFFNNAVDEWDDTPGGRYDGVGENQNGAAIRLNFHSTGEVYKCTFRGNQAVTGGAIGATSINKLTIMDSSFEKNISTAYNTKSSTRRRIAEGAGALRVDRTAKPLEIYRTNFEENAANIKASVMEVFIRPLRARGGSETGPFPGGSQYSLIIDGCIFKNNKYYNFKNARDPERGDFFSGCILFHSGNFKGPKMKIINSQFVGNEVAESTIRTFLEFELSNSIFANTNFIRLKDKNGKFRTTGKGALMLRGEPRKGLIQNCTFYSNEPNPNDPTRSIASDIFFFKGTEDKYTLNNSIFYRKNKQNAIQQVSRPIKGRNNVQFIPGANMSSFGSVSKSRVNTNNPNIIPNSIIDMCLGTNSLPANSGGLKDCGSETTTPPVPTVPVVITPVETPTPTVPTTPTPANPINNSNAPIGKTIWLKANNGSAGYVTADLSAARTPLRANRNRVARWEQFRVEDAGNGKVHLRALANNKYVQARINEEGQLITNSNNKLGWETFTWENRGNGKVAFKAFNNKYVRARLAIDTKELGAVANDVKGWETFSWAVVGGAKSSDITTINSKVFATPNPTYTANKVILNGVKQTDTVSIYSINGQQFTNLNQLQGTTNEVDISKLPNGIYFIKVGEKTIKLIVN